MADPKTYPKRPPPPTRVDIDPAEFNALISDFGAKVRVTPSGFCPRRSGREISEVDNNHDLNCPLCNGALIIDFDANSYETDALALGIKTSETYYPQSKFDLRDVFITFRSEQRVGMWWKVEVLDFSTLFNQVVLRRAGGDIDRIRYPGIDVGDGAKWMLMDGDGAAYDVNTDYTVADTVVTWTGTNRPPDGKLYTFTYPMLPTYRIIDFVHENRYYYTAFRRPDKLPVQLPQQAHCRFDSLAKRGHDVLIGG